MRLPMLTCESKILLMQRLQDYARLDYRYYFQGEVGLDKLNSLSRKFAQQYDTELSKFQRSRRKRSARRLPSSWSGRPKTATRRGSGCWPPRVRAGA